MLASWRGILKQLLHTKHAFLPYNLRVFMRFVATLATIVMLGLECCWRKCVATSSRLSSFLIHQVMERASRAPDGMRMPAHRSCNLHYNFFIFYSN